MSVAKPRLVVVDVLQRVKPQGKPGQNSYENDYQAMERVTAYGLATARIAVGVCTILAKAAPMTRWKR